MEVTVPHNNSKKKHSYYQSHAGPKLKEQLVRLATIGQKERRDLSEEVDLARVMVQETVKMLRLAEQAEDKPQLKVMALAALRDAVDHVARIVHTHSRVEALHPAFTQDRYLQFFIDRLNEALTIELDGDTEKVRACIDRVCDIPVPEELPDGDVMSGSSIRAMLEQMHESVPSRMDTSEEDGVSDNGVSDNGRT